MNNKFFALAIAGTLALASCQNEGTGTMDDTAMQARIDSAVNAREEQMRTELAMQNDSLINAMAMMKADSMMTAMGNTGSGMSRTPVRTTRPTTTTRTPATTQPTRTTQDDKFDARENGNAPTITPQKAKEQDDKFNQRGGGN